MVDEEEGSSESENEQVSARRSARDRRPTEQYKYRDLDVDEESDWEVSEVLFVYLVI